MTIRTRKQETWKLHEFAVANGGTVEQGKQVCLETNAGANQGFLVPAATSTTLAAIGFAVETVVGDGVKTCTVDLVKEIEIEWLPNAASPNDVQATDRGGVCYMTSTGVTITGSGASIAGRVWDVRGSGATSEVAVQKLEGTVPVVATGDIAADQVTPGTAYQAFGTNAAGTASEWQQDPNGYAALDATDDVAITVSQGFRRRITASGDGKDITIGTAGARAGMAIDFVRAALGASTGCTLVNGGTGAGDLLAMTANKKAGARVMFDGTNWALVAAYQES